MTDIRRFACSCCGEIFEQDLHDAQISELAFQVKSRCVDCRQNLPEPFPGMNAEEFYNFILKDA